MATSAAAASTPAAAYGSDKAIQALLDVVCGTEDDHVALALRHQLLNVAQLDRVDDIPAEVRHWLCCHRCHPPPSSTLMYCVVCVCVLAQHVGLGGWAHSHTFTLLSSAVALGRIHSCAYLLTGGGASVNKPSSTAVRECVGCPQHQLLSQSWCFSLDLTLLTPSTVNTLARCSTLWPFAACATLD